MMFHTVLLLTLLVSLEPILATKNCHGDVELPSTKNLSVQPAFDKFKRGDDISISVKMESPFKLDVTWVFYLEGHIMYIGDSKEVNGRIIASREENHDVYTFRLTIKNYISESLSGGVWMNLHIAIPGCSSVVIQAHLDSLPQQNQKYPTLLEIPREVYRVKRNHGLELTIKAKYATMVYESDSAEMETLVLSRTGNKFTDTSGTHPPHVNSSTTHQTHGEYRTLDRSILLHDLEGKDMEWLSIPHTFFYPNGDERSVTIHFLTMIKVHDTLRPIVYIRSSVDGAKTFYRRIGRKCHSACYNADQGEDRRTIAVPKSDSLGYLFQCIADVPPDYIIAFAKVSRGSKVDIFEDISGYRIQTIVSGTYLVPSLPEVEDTYTYVCSTSAGHEVVSDFVDVISFVPVKVTTSRGDDSFISVNQSEAKETVFACNATGQPTPHIKFYMTQSREEAAIFYEEDNEEGLSEYEIKENTAFRVVERRHSDGMALATLIIDTSNENLSASNSSMAVIACVGRNDYSKDVMAISVSV